MASYLLWIMDFSKCTVAETDDTSITLLNVKINLQQII